MMSRKRWEPCLAEREQERQDIKAASQARVGVLSDRELELVADVGDAYVGCLVVRVLQGRKLYQEIEGIWRGIASGSFRMPGSVAS